METKVVDARGEQCPIPVVKATKALQEMGSGTLEVHVDNAVAVQNLQRMASGRGLQAAEQQLAPDHYVVTIPVGDGTAEAAMDCGCAPLVSGDTIVVIGTSEMGSGSAELGATLLKGFVFAVSQLPELPKTVLLYNGGVKLAVPGSDSLQDLQELERQGVEILACGTCLNYYGLTEQLAVGSVTNMYQIVEKMSGAGKIIRP